MCQSGSTAPSFRQVCHVGNLTDRSTVRRDWAADESEEPPPAEPPMKKQRSETTKSSQQSHSTVFHTSVVELSSTSDSSSSSDLVLSDSETVTTLMSLSNLTQLEDTIDFRNNYHYHKLNNYCIVGHFKVMPEIKVI